MGERVNSKADQVYDELKEAILAGRVEPGELIDKSALCERLGVSRFPVSAAVSRLAFENLVVIEPQHGSFVARISAADVRERMFIRRALESEIAAEAARRMPREPDSVVFSQTGQRASEAAMREKHPHGQQRSTEGTGPGVSRPRAVRGTALGERRTLREPGIA